jgi:hypothetical protein
MVSLRQTEGHFPSESPLGQRQDESSENFNPSVDGPHPNALHEDQSHFVCNNPSIQDALLMNEKVETLVSSSSSYTLRRAYNSHDSIHQTSLKGVGEESRTRIRTLSFSQFRESLRSNHKKPDCNSSASTAA